MPTFRYEGLAGIHDNFALEPKNLCSFPLTFENFINQKERKIPSYDTSINISYLTKKKIPF